MTIDYQITVINILNIGVPCEGGGGGGGILPIIQYNNTKYFIPPYKT